MSFASPRVFTQPRVSARTMKGQANIAGKPLKTDILINGENPAAPRRETRGPARYLYETAARDRDGAVCMDNAPRRGDSRESRLGEGCSQKCALARDRKGAVSLGNAARCRNARYL